MLLTKKRSNGARARHALVKEIVTYVIGLNVLQSKQYESSFSSVKPLKMFSFQLHIFFIIPGKRNVKSTSFDEKNPEVTFVFINKN